MSDKCCPDCSNRDVVEKYGHNLNAMAARIRELEAEIARRDDFRGCDGCSTGDCPHDSVHDCAKSQAETIREQAACIEQIVDAAGDEDPLELIAAAKKLQRLGDKARAYPGRTVFVDTSHPDLADCGIKSVGIVEAFVDYNADEGFWMGNDIGTEQWAACWCNSRPDGSTDYCHVTLDCAYSTREAAEAARDTNA